MDHNLLKSPGYSPVKTTSGRGFSLKLNMFMFDYRILKLE